MCMFNLLFRLDGQTGEGHVTEVTPYDRPLSHPQGTSYASTVRKSDPAPVAGNNLATQGKPREALPSRSSYAEALRQKEAGSRVSNIDREPRNMSDHIDEILSGPGKASFCLGTERSSTHTCR